jgi:hypothetical protein
MREQISAAETEGAFGVLSLNFRGSTNYAGNIGQLT